MEPLFAIFCRLHPVQRYEMENMHILYLWGRTNNNEISFFRNVLLFICAAAERTDGCSRHRCGLTRLFCSFHKFQPLSTPASSMTELWSCDLKRDVIGLHLILPQYCHGSQAQPDECHMPTLRSQNYNCSHPTLISNVHGVLLATFGPFCD